MLVEKKRIKKILNLLFVLFCIVWIIIQLLFLFLVALDRADLIYNTPPLSYIFASFTDHSLSDSEVIEFYKSILPIYFAIAITIGITGSLIISRGRTLEEGLAILIAYAIPRRRKLSGRVFDVNTGINIPFIDVRVIDQESNKIVASAITDMEGRYRINLSKSKETYAVRVQVQGFQLYEKDLTNIYKNNVIQDIPMENSDNIESGIKSFYFYYLKPRFYIYFTYLLFFIALVTLVSVVATTPMIGLSIYHLTFIIIFTSSVTWNTLTIFGRLSFGAGRILEFETNRPIEGAGVSIFDKEKQLLSQYTNERGVIRINLPEGIYETVVSKLGYEMVNSKGEREKSEELFINKDGYLPIDLYLKQLSENSKMNITKLDSPFGQ